MDVYIHCATPINGEHHREEGKLKLERTIIRSEYSGYFNYF